MSSLDSTLLMQQCRDLLSPIHARARSGDASAYNPTPEGAAMLAALAAKYRDIPVADPALDVMYLIPRDKWPEGLDEMIEAALNG